MTDIPITPEVAAEYAKLSPSMQAQADRAYGGAFSRQAQDEEAPPTVSNTANLHQVHLETGKTVVSYQTDGHLAREQMVSGARALYPHNPSAALEYAKTHGIKPEEIGAGADEAPTPPNAEPVIAGLEPPASPDGYQIDVPAHAVNDAPEDVASILNAVKDGFFEAGVPRQMANGLAQALLKGADFDPEAPEPDDVLRFQYQAEGARVRSLNAPAEETMRYYELARSVLPAKLIEHLDEHRAFHHAESIVQMANFGRIVEARRARK